MGFVQSVMGAVAQGGQYDAAKRMKLVEGEAARDAAYAQATAKGEAGKRQVAVVAENMARAAGNKRREMAAARAAAAGSGFTDEGSGDKAEEVVGRVHGLSMADMARAGSEGSLQAFNEQVALRKQGDAQLRAAQIEARQLGAMASASRTGAWFNALGGIVGGAVGAYQGVEGAFDAGNVSNADLMDAGVGGFAFGADAGSGLMASGNPFTAHLVRDGWDRRLMGMLGVGKIK